MTRIEEQRLLAAMIDKTAVARLKRQTRRQSDTNPKPNPDSERIQVLRFKRKIGIKT
ncbi:hypothetical protein [Hoeflea sp.]|uniref:hypothetical protein n=1 Tax=Hoeflea sp. TaxID=1940281 RepID=UPI003B52DB17